MKFLVNVIFASTLIAMSVAPCSGQDSEEDVIILNSGKIFRGTVMERFVYGGTITIWQQRGRTASVSMSEICAMWRLPVGIPDSALVKSFLRGSGDSTASNPGGARSLQHRDPSVDLIGHPLLEDVVFLNDGSMNRGLLLGDPAKETITLWIDGRLREFPGKAVKKVVRAEKGTADSILIMTYINIPEEWSAGEVRIFSAQGGLAIPSGGWAKATDPAMSEMSNGFVLGVDAGVQLGHGVRWLTTASYSSHSRTVPENVTEIDAPGNATHGNVITVLTGAELRTFGPSLVKLHVFAQAGVSLLHAAGYQMNVPQTFYHLPGTVKVDEISTSSVAFSVGGGLIVGRFGLDVRYTLSRPTIISRTEAEFIYGYTRSAEHTTDESAGMFVFTLGASIY